MGEGEESVPSFWANMNYFRRKSTLRLALGNVPFWVGMGERERGRDCSIHTFTTELSPGEMEQRKGAVDGLTRIKWCVKKSHGNPFINSLISKYNFRKERERV